MEEEGFYVSLNFVAVPSSLGRACFQHAWPTQNHLFLFAVLVLSAKLSQKTEDIYGFSVDVKSHWTWQEFFLSLSGKAFLVDRSGCGFSSGADLSSRFCFNSDLKRQI